MSKLENLRQIIIKANPEIESRNISVLIPEPFKGIINYRDDTIRLADVLVVMQKCQDDLLYVNKYGNIGDWRTKTVLTTWNLLDDNLSHQSEDCISFLHDLLSK